MSDKLTQLFSEHPEPEETREVRSYRAMNPQQRAFYVSDFIVRHLNALGHLLANQTYVGLSVTSGGDLSVTLLFDGGKEKVYLYPEMGAEEAEEELVAAVERLRGLARRRR